MQHRNALPAERLLKAWARALTATSLAAASHGLAAGHLPHPLIWALATSLSALVCLAFTDRKLPKLCLAGSVGCSQFILHILYSHAGGVSTVGSVQAEKSLAGAAHSAHHAGRQELLLTTAEPASQQLGLNWMALLHTLAALLTYLLIRYGQVCAHRTLETLSLGLAFFLKLPARLPSLPAAPLRLAFFGPSFCPKAFLKRPAISRGPPLSTLV